MNNKIKGGLMCLLYCFLTQLSAQSFIIDKDSNSSSYGMIGSPKLDKAMIESIDKEALSFQEWSSFFSVKVSGSTRSILGSYQLKGDRIFFLPRFLPDPNVTYTLTFSEEKLSEYVVVNNSIGLVEETTSFRLIASQKTSIQATSIQGDFIPSNTLRFYIYFSGSMGFENPYKFIKFYNGNGKEITDPFVELPEGLWNDDRTRLTVLFHPGRVKRGVGPNVKQGEILNEGEKYEVKISDDWMDANGNKLEQSFSQKFEISKPLRSKINIEDWKISSRCGESCSIMLLSDRIIDIEMASRLITVKDDQDQTVEFKVHQKQQELILTSDSFMKSKEYTIIINPKLEDICGNTFLNVFDYEVGKRTQRGDDITRKISIK